MFAGEAEESNPNTVHKKTSSSYFFIENVFYNDMRWAWAEDYSRYTSFDAFIGISADSIVRSLNGSREIKGLRNQGFLCLRVNPWKEPSWLTLICA